MIHYNTEGYVANLVQGTEREFSYTKPLETGDWDSWKASFHEHLRELVGLNHIESISKGLSLSPHVVSIEQFDTYTTEKGYITTEPGIEIPYYLLLPKEGDKPFPLVLTPHGHSRRGKEVYVGNFENEAEKEGSLY